MVDSVSSVKGCASESSSCSPVFAAVVLHYLSSELTKQCIASLQNLDMTGGTLKIVIVDNASSNESGEELRKLYVGDDSVHVLLNEENLGFSIANNKGFEYAIRTWNPDAVLVLNNDVQIAQEDFCDVLQKELLRRDVYVISPDVYVPRTGEHQSPLREQPLSIEDTDRLMAHYQSILDGSKQRTLKYRLKKYAIVRYMLNLRAKWYKRKRDQSYRTERLNVVPSGATLIFTRRFIETGELPFVPATFLYYEEDILALRCKRNGWDILYCPDLQVLHLHEGATNVVAPTQKEKELFIAKHYYDSLSILRECYG